MKRILGSLLIAVLLITCAASSLAQGQTVGSLFFVKVDGIAGESTQASHVGEIDAFAFKLGVAQRGVSDFGGGASAGKAQFLPVVIYKNVDVSSPALFLACATGQHIKKVELMAARFVSDQLQTYLTITLSDVIISGINHESADSDGSRSVLETVSLNFAKIEIAYRKTNSDGTLAPPVKAGYDLKANKKLVAAPAL